MPACAGAGVLFSALSIAGATGVLPPEVEAVIGDALFYCSVREYIMDNIILGSYRESVAQNLGLFLGLISTTLVTIWVMFHGFKIITGENRNPVLPLFISGGRMVLILGVVSLSAANSPYIAETVSGFKDVISTKVAGNDALNITGLIDLNLGLAAVVNNITESTRTVADEKDRTPVTATLGLIGQTGPAMLLGVLLMLAELSVTMGIMLAPIFIFFLLFQQTTTLFWAWAKFLLGALFTIATLTLIGTLALKATAFYAGTVIVNFYINALAGGDTVDMAGSALRLAALGTIMAAIIIAIPQTVMQFFSAGAGFAAGAFGFAGAGALAAASRSGGGGTSGYLAAALGRGSANEGRSTSEGGGAGARTAGGGGAGGGGEVDYSNTSTAQALSQVSRLGNGTAGNGYGESGATGLPNAGAVRSSAIGLASADNPNAASFSSFRGRQAELAQAQELRPNSAGVYAAAGADRALEGDAALGRGGRLAVSGTNDSLSVGGGQVAKYGRADTGAPYTANSGGNSNNGGYGGGSGGGSPASGDEKQASAGTPPSSPPRIGENRPELQSRVPKGYKKP